MKKLRVLELFGGIGACTKALKNLGIDYELVDYVEIDKYAVKSYNALNNTNFEPQDISKWDKDVDVDILFHGSPCQDFSIIGKQAGGDKGSGTRSSLMYETLRIVEKTKPTYIVWENVKNLLSKNHVHNLKNYINELDRLGYDSYYTTLNAKDFAIPQTRERLFVVSIRKGAKPSVFLFPCGVDKPCPRLLDFIDKDVDQKYYLSEKGINYVLDINDVQKGTKWEGSTSKGKVNKDYAMTIGCRSSSYQRAGVTNYILDGYDREVTVAEAKEIYKQDPSNFHLRKLTPRECWRLMGFTNEDFDKVKDINSDTQLYKQAGNSIVVTVMERILYVLLYVAEVIEHE
jgi:DNA (cytosine-5)-methyltransferase 1